MKTEWIKQLRNAKTKIEIANIWAEVMTYRHTMSEATWEILFNHYWNAVQRIKEEI